MKSRQTDAPIKEVVKVAPGDVKGNNGRFLPIAGPNILFIPRSPCFQFIPGESPQLAFTIRPKTLRTLTAIFAVVLGFAIPFILNLIRVALGEGALFDDMSTYKFLGGPIVGVTYLFFNAISHCRIHVDLAEAHSIIADPKKKQIAVLSDFSGKEAWVSVECGTRFDEITERLKLSPTVVLQEGPLLTAEPFKKFLLWVLFAMLLSVMAIAIVFLVMCWKV